MLVKPLLPLLPLLLLSSCIVSADRAKEKFDKFVAVRTDCTEDDECISRNFGCPLGCQTVFNREYESEVENKAQKLISRYERGGRRCDYGCTEPLDPVCEAGTCSLR